MKEILRLIVAPMSVLFLFSHCKEETKRPAVGQCDCETTSVLKEKKNVEAIVILIAGNQSPVMYGFSTDPKDFGTTTYSLGENMLVPCDSLPAAYQKPGAKVIVSYKRKNCYGAVTFPFLRSSHGYFIKLTAIRLVP